MGDVYALIKVMPDEPNKGKELEEKVLKTLGEIEGVKINKSEIEPVAFGIEAVKVSLILDGKKEGLIDEVEKKLNEIEIVSSVSVEELSLI